MKKVILDTDIGADCDDVIALEYLLKKMKAKECEIIAITTCTRRKYASAATKRILHDFGFLSIPIGEYDGNPLPCDSFDHYAKELAEGVSIRSESATKLIRKALMDNEKTDLVCIGPLCNIFTLLQSGPDEISNQNGVKLIQEKVGKMYVMGGAFEFSEGETSFVEWNFEQDLVSAKMVLKEFPREIVLCPSEVGARVMTYKENTSGLTRGAMGYFFQSINQPHLLMRPSWDPLTCMVALKENDFHFSDRGCVQISERGYTKFIPSKEGQIKYLDLNNDFKAIEKRLNDALKGDEF